jgi:hypothetical protein
VSGHRQPTPVVAFIVANEKAIAARSDFVPLAPKH